MLLKFLYFFVVIQGISGAFPKYIEQCSEPDPNAHKCLLEKARKAFAVLIHGSKELNLRSFEPYTISNIKLPVGNNSEIVISDGLFNLSNDTQISQARISLQQKYWYILYSAKMITLNLNFTITVKGAKNNTVTAKGRTLITLINTYYEYTGYYEIVTIENQKYMQIKDSKTKLGYEKYRQKILQLTTTDNKKLNDSDQKVVLKPLSNLEPTIDQYVDAIGKAGNTNTFNTILKLEPADKIFKN